MKVIDETSFFETFQYFDKSIVVEIIELFIAEYPERIASIQKNIEQGDFNGLKFNTHSLKGIVANFFAEDPQNYARELESKGMNNDADGLDDLFQKLDQSCLQLIDELRLIKQRFVE